MNKRNEKMIMPDKKFSHASKNLSYDGTIKKLKEMGIFTLLKNKEKNGTVFHTLLSYSCLQGENLSLEQQCLSLAILYQNYNFYNIANKNIWSSRGCVAEDGFIFLRKSANENPALLPFYGTYLQQIVIVQGSGGLLNEYLNLKKFKTLQATLDKMDYTPSDTISKIKEQISIVFNLANVPSCFERGDYTYHAIEQALTEYLPPALTQVSIQYLAEDVLLSNKTTHAKRLNKQLAMTETKLANLQNNIRG